MGDALQPSLGMATHVTTDGEGGLSLVTMWYCHIEFLLSVLLGTVKYYIG